MLGVNVSRSWLYIYVTPRFYLIPTPPGLFTTGCSLRDLQSWLYSRFRLQDGMTRYFSVHEALDIAEAVLFAELMTFAALFTLTHLDGIPRSMPLIHGLLLAAGLLAARVVRAHCGQRTDDSRRDYRCRRERIVCNRGKSLRLVLHPIT